MITKPLPGVGVDPLHNFPELIAYWTMNEGSGSSINDISGNGNHGVLQNVVPNTQGSGWCGSPHGGCIGLNGTDNYIACPKRNNCDIGSFDFSIETMIKHTTVATSVTIFYDVGNGPEYDGVRATINGSGLLRANLVYNNDWNISAFSTDRVDDNKWHHLVATFDRDKNAQTYIDGVPNGSAVNISTLAGDISNDAPDYTIGKNYFGAEYFGGLMEYVRLYRGLLTPSNIYKLSRNPFGIHINSPIYQRYVAALVNNPMWYYNMLRRRT